MVAVLLNFGLAAIGAQRRISTFVSPATPQQKGLEAGVPGLTNFIIAVAAGTGQFGAILCRGRCSGEKKFEMRFTFPKFCVSIYEKWKKELKQ